MKNSLKLFAAAISIVAAVSCTQEKIEPSGTSPEMVTLNFISDGTLDTKTVLNVDNTVSWCKTGESLRVFELTDGATSGAATAGSDAVIDETTGVATFTASFSTKTANKFTYYSVYPESAWQKNDNNNVTAMKIYGFKNDNGVQTPSLDSFDPTADRLISLPAESTTQQINVPLPLQFKRISALGKMKITGLDDDEVVNHISFIAPSDTYLDGRSSFNLVTSEVKQYCDYSRSNSIQISYASTPGFKNNNTAYFMCWPATIDAGDIFTVVVRTDQNSYMKNVTIPSGKSIEFSEGQASAFSVDMKDQAVESLTVSQFLEKSVGDTYYKLTGTISEIEAGDYGNFKLTDNTGTIYVYGLNPYFATSDLKSFTSLGLKENDVVTIVGKRSRYTNPDTDVTTEQVGNAFYESHKSSTTETETKYYVKVTTAPADWSGEYLIVSEDNNVALDGSLNSGYNSSGNTQSITIEDGKILATTETTNISFIIASKVGGYSIKSKSGKYIGKTSKDAYLNTDSSDRFTNNITLGDNSVIVITSTEDPDTTKKVLQCNSNTIKFYAPAGQKPVYLYKLEES